MHLLFGSLTHLPGVDIEVQTILATLHLLQNDVDLARLGANMCAPLDIWPVLWLHGRLEAELAHRRLGERDALEAVVVVAVDGLPLHPLHLSVDRVGDDLVIAAQALLVRLELDVAARINMWIN